MSKSGLIIIIDSDVQSAQGFEEILRTEGYTVHASTSGVQALKMIENLPPDLVLLDTDLSDIDAFTLRASLMEDKKTRDVPVIFIFAEADDEKTHTAIALGDDHIRKPIDAREVLTRVERQVTVARVRMALRESEAKFQSVMESAIDAIISADASGKIRAWNRAATILFGHNAEEAIGQPIELIIPERYHDPHRTGLKRVSEGGESRVIGRTVELSAVRKSNVEFPIELSLATWFLDDERYFTGIIRDISERKQAEQKFRSVTESAIDGIISADHTGKIVSWNNAATRILGYTAEETIGQQLELIIPERFQEPHREGMRRVTAGGESRVIGRTVELSACAKGGLEVPIELSLSTWTVRNERYYTGIIRDIRERKQAEETLRRSEQALRERTLELKSKNEELEQTLNQLHETQNQLILQEKMASLGKLSAGMAHELNNPASAAQRSATQLQAIFLQFQDAQWRLDELKIDDETMAKVKALEELAREGAGQPADLDALMRGDRESELEDWLNKRHVESGWKLAPVLVALGYDQARLSALAEGFTTEQFPAVVNWFTHLHTIYKLLAEISLGTGRIAEIVGALKRYTYMDQAPVQTVDVHQGLDSTLVILHGKLKRGITVRRAYATDLPFIHAHASELNQVWTNIIDNAIDAMAGQGTLVLRTRLDGDWVVVEIEDDGPGIPGAIQSNIFDPFFTTKAPGEGTGLGLNITRNIVVQKHKGQIDVTSQPGKTRFTVRLPIDSHKQDEAKVVGG
jgi:PAS domain S-box-containing protein